MNEAACDLAREAAGKGDALVAGGICQTSLYRHHKDEVRVKKLFQLQLEVFIKKNVDFLIAEVSLVLQGKELLSSDKSHYIIFAFMRVGDCFVPSFPQGTGSKVYVHALQSRQTPSHLHARF